MHGDFGFILRRAIEVSVLPSRLPHFVNLGLRPIELPMPQNGRYRVIHCVGQSDFDTTVADINDPLIG
jgi:hypothetical protein